MSEYTIGAIAKLTGLSVHNLRTWEKRYQAVVPERTPNGRRVYTEPCLARLKLLKSCVDLGATISTLAHLSDAQLKSTLAQMQTADDSLQPISISNACLVGTGMVNWLFSVVERLIPGVQIDVYPSLAALERDENAMGWDLMVIDQASISAMECKIMVRSIKQLNVPNTILLYRYARHQDIAYFKSLGVNVFKAPIDESELETALRAQVLNQRPSTPRGVSRNNLRKFSDVELQRAAAMSTSIECECPQHLAEIIRGLVAFEVYSSQCVSKDKAGEDLHRHIHLQTGEARAVMEELLKLVLDQEGLDLAVIGA